MADGGSKGDIGRHQEQVDNSRERMVENWQNDFNEFIVGTINNPMGRLRQTALVGEGLIFGGITDIAKEWKVETAEKAGASLLVGSVIGTILTSRNSSLKTAVQLLGSIGALAYGVDAWKKYSKDQELSTALDAVYKNSDLNTFSKQIHTANKQLGEEGFNLGLVGLTGGLGMAVGREYGYTVTSKITPGFTKRIFENVFMPSPKTSAKSVDMDFYAKHKEFQVLRHNKNADRFATHCEETSAAVNHEPSWQKAISEEECELFNASQMRRSFEHARDTFLDECVNGEISVIRSSKGPAGYTFDKSNRIVGITVPEGATPAEVGRQLLVGCSSDTLGKPGDVLMYTALKGSKKFGYDGAQPGDLAVAAKEGKPFSESKIGELRRTQGAQRYVVEGSEAYYRGENGNDYTDWMRGIHGIWTSERQAEADWLLSKIVRAQKW
ncbi:MAG: hypothetical protein K2Y22_02260 [Candidatus Obscuribacterales bacterium]|nr:hypothetical protein [Candidatus Obscuribacterales bacterium]